MRDAFHDDLSSITDDLVEMTRMTGAAIERATRALLDADQHLAESVIAADDDLDEMRRAVDNLVVDLLARQQPVATDLRSVITAMQMASDIERMGDLARHIAKVARRRHPEHAIPDELREVITSMMEAAVHLAKSTGTAISTRDVNAAMTIEGADDAMDALHRRIFGHLLDDTWKHGTEAAVDITLVSRYYERFGDHAVSVANRIIYLVTGRY
ncbi:phosphate signaling complex protein PhoU [Leekyejoonella antrihumi]|uniref:Phosphate-specific transport system accessory protein PhoU n=1 Tax=Leekyejoonella antrihumi TaxID=1660198 RepID=A0A563E998_9MICO|nr:phosphate signaling complex protein PhoU [Leekyejoonella antrihumi]TWP38899.1 phosphate signaling complex protein PhoU [Leekyejoonella antrihumi]